MEEKKRFCRGLPQHFLHLFRVQSISVIHEDETVLLADHSLINPKLFGIDIGVVRIVCQ